MISFKIIIGILFGLLVTTISVLGIISYQNSRASNYSAVLVQHTHEVLDQVEEISSLSKDIQLESNAFFITGDSASLIPYINAKKVISKLENIRVLTHDNPGQQSRIDTLELLLTKLMSFTDSVLFITKEKTYSENRMLNRIMGNKFFRDRIRTVINRIKNEESRLLIIHQKTNEESIAAFEKTFFLLLIVIGILLATTFFSIRYNFNKRIRAQRELKIANELFGKLFYESPIGLVITRQQDGIILDCNQVYSELMNYTKEEIKGKSAVSLKILDSEAKRNEIVKDALSTKRVKDIETWLKPKDRDPIWASISIQAIQLQNEPCLLNAILDMTSHKHAEDEVRKALDAQTELNKMKSSFVTLASHEFRTPLTTIQSSGFILAKYASRDNQEKVRKQLARIKSSVEYITAILDEFLSLSKIEEGEVKPQTSSLDLKEFMNDVCSNFKRLTKPGQDIIYNHQGDYSVNTDQTILRKIIDNLVSNAIKYSPENSTIYVSSHVNEQIYLSVKDNGIGIPEEDQKHLFERFFRASNAGNIQGTGLGLHILKRYVEMLKGSIEVHSDLGKGTEFKITFGTL